jgi:hypothetical protein
MYLRQLLARSCTHLWFFSSIIFNVQAGSVVAGLRCYFTPLNLGHGLVAKHFPICSRYQPQLCSDQGKQVAVPCKRISCPLLGLFHYRSLPSLCTGTCFWPMNFATCVLGRFPLATHAPQFVSQRAASIQAKGCSLNTSDSGWTK